MQAAAHHIAQEYTVYWGMVTEVQGVILLSPCLLDNPC